MFDDSNIEIVALGSYLVILLGLGVASARQIKSATDYTLYTTCGTGTLELQEEEAQHKAAAEAAAEHRNKDMKYATHSISGLLHSFARNITILFL